MNTNPDAKRVLIFGDSNTWGDPPDDSTGRYDPDTRYPGILQSLLGDDYEVIEEGLCGRTICATSPDDKAKGRVGIDNIVPCLSSHFPLDLLIVNLGTNEYKKRFDLSAQDIADNLQKLCAIVNERQEESVEAGRTTGFEVLILSPGYVDGSKKVDEEFAHTEAISKEIAPFFAEVAKKNNFHFLDLAPVALTGEDGLHYIVEAHKNIAMLLEKKVKEIIE